MTVTPYPLPRETRETTLLLGNGTVGPYGPTPFKVFDVSDVEVWSRPQGVAAFGKVDALIAKSANNELDTVSITFSSAIADTTEFLVIARRTHEREIAVFKGGTLNVVELEKEISKQASVLSELRRDVDRGGSAVPGQPGQTIVFDDNGRPVPGADQGEITNAAENAALAQTAQQATADDRQATAADRKAAEAAVASVNLPLIAPGDGGKMLFVRDDGDGYELGATYLNKVLSPKQLLAVGDGFADDSNAIQNCMEDGRIVEWGNDEDVFRLTRSITPSLTKPVQWKSGGATLLFDPLSSQRNAVSVNGPFKVETEGRLLLDVNRKANIGWSFVNLTDQFREFACEDLAVCNVYRRDQTFTGGDGIFIQGAWRYVHLVRPDVRNILMAAGAGVPLSQGVFGITYRGSSAAAPQPIPGQLVVEDPYIDGVQCEDPAYLQDQDGIRVLDVDTTGSGATPFTSRFILRGGTIRNCRNRAVKSQFEYGLVEGTHFIRDAGLISTAMGNAEIDFQNGGGIVKGAEFHYSGRLPRALIESSGRVDDGRRNAAGLLLSDCRANINGGGNLPTVVSMNMRASRFMMASVKGLHVDASANILSVVEVTSPPTVTGKEVHVHLSDVAAPVASGGTSAFVKRTGGVDMYVSGRNLSRNLDGVVGTPGSGAALFYSPTAGAVTKALDGVNKRVENI